MPAVKTPMLIEAPDGLLGLRDQALLLVGFAGGFRRSELVALNVGDLKFTDEGNAVTLRRSKTDQEGASRKLGIPYRSNAKTVQCGPCGLVWLRPASIGEPSSGRSTGTDRSNPSGCRIRPWHWW